MKQMPLLSKWQPWTQQESFKDLSPKWRAIMRGGFAWFGFRKEGPLENKARDIIRLRNNPGFRPGFLRFWRGDRLQKKIDRAIAEMEAMFGPEEVKKAKAEPAPTPDKRALPMPQRIEPSVERRAPRQPQPNDFGVTPEQVAAYRPAPPSRRPDPLWFRCLVGCLAAPFFVIALCGLVGLPAVILVQTFGWQATFVIVVGAFGFWCMFRLSRYDPHSRELRGRVESYLRAKAEYEQALRNAELERRRQKEDYWRSLSGPDFETEMARLYKADGYAVKTTPVTGDQGADLFLRRDGELTVVQCKRHNKPVGPATVRDLHGTLLHFRGNRAILAATGGFTEGARQHAHGKPIELLDLDGILRLQEALTRAKTAGNT